MKSLLVLAFSILFISNNVFADSKESYEKNCKNNAEIITRGFVLLKAGKNRVEICKNLLESFGVKQIACDSTINAIENTKKKYPKVTKDDVQSSVFDYCMSKAPKEIEEVKPDSLNEDGWTTPEELVGAYVLVQDPDFVKEKFNLVEDPFGDKYQWFIFEKDGRFRILTANKDVNYEFKKDLEEILDSMDRMSGGSSPTYYKFIEEGFIILHKKATPKKGLVWSVNSVRNKVEMKNGVIWEVGDIILGLDKNGENVYHKQLRRLKDK